MVWKGGRYQIQVSEYKGRENGGRGGDQNNKSKSKHETVIQRVVTGGTSGTGVVVKRK